MKIYKCVIFDCDGVLVDSEALSNQVMVDMANEYGANIDLSYAMKNFKGGFLKDCINQIENIILRSLPKNFETDYRVRSFKVFAENLKPIIGIEKVLNQLSIPFCVASSGPANKIRSNLTLTGLINFFEGKIFSCYDIDKWKPDPAIFLHVASTMGFEPKECLVIEDSIKGVIAAKNGGFDVFGFAADNEDKNFEKEATKLFYHMDELIPMLTSYHG